MTYLSTLLICSSHRAGTPKPGGWADRQVAQLPARYGQRWVETDWLPDVIRRQVVRVGVAPAPRIKVMVGEEGFEPSTF